MSSNSKHDAVSADPLKKAQSSVEHERSNNETIQVATLEATNQHLNISSSISHQQKAPTWAPSVLRIGPLVGLSALGFAFLQIQGKVHEHKALNPVDDTIACCLHIS